MACDGTFAVGHDAAEALGRVRPPDTGDDAGGRLRLRPPPGFIGVDGAWLSAQARGEAASRPASAHQISATIS